MFTETPILSGRSCRVCQCTHTQPCDPPCAWISAEEDLCSTCADAAADLLMTMAEWDRSARIPDVEKLLALVRFMGENLAAAAGGVS